MTLSEQFLKACELKKSDNLCSFCEYEFDRVSPIIKAAAKVIEAAERIRNDYNRHTALNVALDTLNEVLGDE